MTKKPFISNIEEDLNRPHKVTLTEGQISTILYVLEGYIEGNDDYQLDDDFNRDINSIFSELEGVFDTFYEKNDIQCQSNNKDNVTYSEADYVEQCITEGHDYRDCVDTLVDSMKTNNEIARLKTQEVVENRVKSNIL